VGSTAGKPACHGLRTAVRLSKASFEMREAKSNPRTSSGPNTSAEETGEMTRRETQSKASPQAGAWQLDYHLPMTIIHR